MTTAPMTWQLDDDGDLRFEAGRFYAVSGAEAVAQRVRMRLGRWLGEWFLDTRLGVDYRGRVFVKKPDLTAIGSLFRTQILTTPGVLNIKDFALDWNRATRMLTLTFTARTEWGSLEFWTSPAPIHTSGLVLLFRYVGPFMEL